LVDVRGSNRSSLGGPKRVLKTTRSTSVFEKLLSLILSGEWKEGDRIRPERELSQDLGVGRASLREALKALELIGMIESRVGDGTFVCERLMFLSRPLLWAITGDSMTHVDELVESRAVLEGEIAAFAALRATDEDISLIEKQVKHMKTGLNDADILLESDLQFHLAIARAGHNQILFNAVQMIRSLMHQWMLVTLHVPGVGKKVYSQHEAILEAIRAKDPDGARQAMRSHLTDMGALLIRMKSAAVNFEPA
jgi:GntR family transcriptional repressor for pyruvate dehydrogenase complex